jgi:LysR family pca operon transcriptional activator
VVRAGHPLLADADIFAHLEDYPVLMPTRGSISWPFVQRLLIANGVSAMPAECIETVSDAFGRAFLRQSDALWIISQGVVRDDIANGTLCLLDVDTSDTKGPVGLTMRTDTPPLPAFPILLATIREAAGLANGMRA